MLADKSHNVDATGSRKRSRLEARISAEEKALFFLPVPPSHLPSLLFQFHRDLIKLLTLSPSQHLNFILYRFYSHPE